VSVIHLSADEVLAFNAHFVGGHALRDFGLLDGAVQRPQSSAFGEDAFPSLVEKAAALLHALARNHPFVDGNKRTAWTAVNVFFLINGMVISADQGDIVALVVDVSEGLLGVPDIAGVLKEWAQPMRFPDFED
jgi:death-on-curing protein